MGRSGVGWRAVLAGCVTAALGAATARAATVTTVYKFQNGDDGRSPLGPLLAVGNSLYGVTDSYWPLTVGHGTVFRLSLAGSLTTLHTFAGAADGDAPTPGLLLDGATLYGATRGGGRGCYDFGCGTVFAIDSVGGKSTVAILRNRVAGRPNGGLVRAGDALYGVGDGGQRSMGFAYQVRPYGAVRTIHHFFGYYDDSDGAEPVGPLTLATGRLIGATSYGGGICGRRHNTCGTIFSVTPDGTETILHRFEGPDGSLPNGGLLDLGGTLYGTTGAGGASGDGTVYRLTRDGVLTTLHSFAGGADGSVPQGSLVALDGTIYGVTALGGAGNAGTIYSVRPSGAYRQLYAFPAFGSGDPAYPAGGLVAGSDGALYGAAPFGAAKYGAIYRFTP